MSVIPIVENKTQKLGAIDKDWMHGATGRLTLSKL